MIRLSTLLAMSEPHEGVSRNVSGAQNKISTFLGYMEVTN